VRQRSQTIGTLGRAPARQTKDPQRKQSQRLPPLPPTPPPSGGPRKSVVRAWLHEALFENVGLKFLSIVLAITVFLLVNDDKDREITVRVGVGYQLPADKVLVSDRIDEVRVTLRGPWRRLRQLDERELDRISVDLRGQQGDELQFTPDMVHVPTGLRVASIAPRTMKIQFDRRREKRVEITPVVLGKPAHGYRVIELKADPPTATVRGAEKVLAALGTVRTREVALDGHTETFTAEVPIEPPEGVDSSGVDVVSVEVKMDQELVAKKLPDVPITLLGPGGEKVDTAKWIMTPQIVEITLTGPLISVEKAKETLSVTAKLPATGSGARDLPVVIEGVPPGLGVRVSPEHVRVAPARTP
jgi:YbbR domain-containing protein